MTNKLFDSFVNNKLQNYESPVPEGLWEKIMEEEERKPIAFWWWNKNAMMVGIALLFAIAGVVYYSLNTNNEKQLALAIKNNNQEKNENELAKNSNLNKNIVTTNNGATQPNEAVENNKILSNTTNTKSNDVINNTEFESNNNLNSIPKNNFLSSINKSTINENIVANNVTNSNTKFSDKTLNKSFAKKQYLVTPKNKSPHNLIIGLSTNDDELLEQSKVAKTFSNGNIVSLENNLYNTNAIKDAKILAIGKLFSGTDDCPTTRGVFRNDFYVEGYFSPVFVLLTVLYAKSGEK